MAHDVLRLSSDTGHALLTDFPDQTAAEVTFIADLTAQFDQAGLLVRARADLDRHAAHSVAAYLAGMAIG